MFFPVTAQACFSGYFAPSFLDITNTVIGLGVVLLIASFALTIRNKFTYKAAMVPLVFLLIAYFAEHSLYLTNAYLRIGIILLLASYIFLAVKEVSLSAGVIPMIYLAISYYGHLTYVGDCGENIVYLNKVATLVAASWFVYEVSMLYRHRSKSTA